MTEQEAATYRQLVREHRAEALYNAIFRTHEQERVWRMDEDHLGYTHTRCGRHFGPFVSPDQTTDHAVEHDKTCEEARRA